MNENAAKTEKELMEALSAGDRSALKELVEKRAAAVYARCLCRLGDEADARRAAKRTFVRLWTAGGAGAGEAPLAALMRLAKRSADDVLSEREEDGKEEEPFADGLGDGERLAYALYSVGGLIHREVADALGITLAEELNFCRSAAAKLAETGGEAAFKERFRAPDMEADVAAACAGIKPTAERRREIAGALSLFWSIAGAAALIVFIIARIARCGG